MPAWHARQDTVPTLLCQRPTPHALQRVWLISFWNCPTLHSAQTFFTVSWYRPAAQGSQMPPLALPQPSGYDPSPHTGHRKQEICALLLWYMPGEHSSQIDAPARAPNLPGVHSKQIVPPLFSLNRPAKHSTHEPAFVTFEILPAAHFLHRSGSALLLSASYSPGTHGVFRSQYDFPDSVWYFPTGQSSQLMALVPLENLLAGQARHRSSVTLLGSASYSPGTHGVLTLQYDCPDAV